MSSPFLYVPIRHTTSNHCENFFALDGIDGCGKSTVLTMLKAALEHVGKNVEVFHADKDARCPNAIHTKKAGIHHEDPLEVARAIARARMHTIHELIEPALSDNKIVLMDRWHTSARAYQGNWPITQTRKELVERMHGIDHIVHAEIGTIIPQMTYILDLPVEIAHERLQQTEKAESFDDFIEKRGETYFNLVRESYLDTASQFPDEHQVIDATMHINDVYEKISSHLWQQLKLDPNTRPTAEDIAIQDVDNSI